MAGTITERGPGRFELRITHKLLPSKEKYFTFDTREEARAYADKAYAMLARGIVLEELKKSPKPSQDPDLALVIGQYLQGPGIPPARREILEILREAHAGTKLSKVTFSWSDAWVASMKREDNLAPGTIRKRVSALAYALDAYYRSNEKNWANPLKLLPRGYASYSDADRDVLSKKGKEGRTDVTRNRRLLDGEQERIRAVLSGEKREDRERALELPDGDALLMLFDLLVDTGLRLREAYTLAVGHVDARRMTLNVAGTKSRSGSPKPRQVPLKPHLAKSLAAYVRKRQPHELLFPFWDGDPETVDRTTSALSRSLARAFEYAGCEDLSAHDLRHEACCRWFLLRDAKGRWALSDIEIAKIMGWSTLAMALRYASLRGSDIAARIFDLTE